jgi:WD40 repeat protein
LTGGWEGHLRRWDPGSLTEHTSRVRYGHHRSWFNQLHPIPGTRYLLSSGSDRRIQIWDPEGGELRQVLRGHTREIWSAALTSDGKTLFTTGDDGTIKEWLLDREISLGLTPRPKRSHYFTGASADGRRAATLVHESLVVWNVDDEDAVRPTRTAVTGVGRF